MGVKSELTSIRLDPVVLGAIRRLGELWNVRNRDGTINRSEVIRRAVIYAYFVINGIDPARANELVRETMERKLIELGEYGLSWILKREKMGMEGASSP